MTAANEMKKDALVNELGKSETALLWLERRYYFLKDYQDAIDRDLGEAKSKITVQNDVVQQLAYDCFDMLVNDLTSFCEGVTQRRGFLEMLKRGVHHLKPRTAEDFEVPNIAVFGSENMTPEQIEEERRQSRDPIVHLLVKGQRESFEALFPGTKKRGEYVVTEKDINLLTREFRALYKKVKTYRDSISAHRYERGNKDLSAPTLNEVLGLLKDVEKLMNRIRLILTNSWLDYHNFFQWNTKETAKDLLDMAVCGCSSQIRWRFGMKEGDAGEYYWQLREKFYTEVRKFGKLPDAK